MISGTSVTSESGSLSINSHDVEDCFPGSLLGSNHWGLSCWSLSSSCSWRNYCFCFCGSLNRCSWCRFCWRSRNSAGSNGIIAGRCEASFMALRISSIRISRSSFMSWFFVRWTLNFDGGRSSSSWCMWLIVGCRSRSYSRFGLLMREFKLNCWESEDKEG